jgi:hypothetical protein
MSADPFGWATSHYGRWGFSQAVGGWVWAPDLTWGPSWVTWSQSGGDFGWSPMLPTVYVGLGVTVPMAAWQFCPAEHVLDVNLTGFYEPAARVSVLHQQARIMTNYGSVGGARVVVGPSADALRTAHVTVRPVKLDMTAAGRMSATDAKAAAVHAQANKATFEANNTKRIQADTKLRAVEAKTKPEMTDRAAKSQPQVTRPEPTKPATRPEATKPATTRPEATKPATTRPETTKPETKTPETTRPETTRPEATRPEATRPEATKPETTRPDTTRTETTRPTTTKPAQTQTPAKALPSREQGAEKGAEGVKRPD